MIQQNIIISVAVIIIAISLLKIANYIINKAGEKRQVLPKRIYYVTKFTHFIIYVLLILTLALVWSVELSGVMIFASSIFAVIGVALFAQWSILSNLTSSIIIFFTFPARVGDNIKILDGDNSVEGEIKEISLFQIEIIDKDGNIVLYPNNLFIQKPIIKMKQNSSSKK